jgi:hypothetical protein
MLNSVIDYDIEKLLNPYLGICFSFRQAMIGVGYKFTAGAR